MSWQAVVHSEIGTKHSHQNLPCQDYGHFLQVGSTLLGAVSDGAGSARHAEVGSKLAVQTALAYLQDQPLPGTAPLSNAEAEQLFTDVLQTVVAKLQEQAESAAYELRDLSCTLLTFIATPDWVAAMQVGDGFLVVEASPTHYELLFSPAKGEYINETCFVTSAHALEHMQVGIYSSPTPFVCAATDGLERVALRLSDWSPFSPFFQPFADCLRQAPEQAGEYLQTFLASDRLNARTDDDKTLLVCVYDHHPQPPDTERDTVTDPVETHTPEGEPCQP